jgi:hypothetical protein
MISELHKFRAELWERSGHNMHKMIQIIEKEADEIMRKYGKIPAKRVQSTNVSLPTAKN